MWTWIRSLFSEPFSRFGLFLTLFFHQTGDAAPRRLPIRFFARGDKCQRSPLRAAATAGRANAWD
jgi:hypothetical protein